VLLCEDYPPDLLGGIARFTQDKATALARMGHIVHVVASGRDVDTVDFEDGVWVHRIMPKQLREEVPSIVPPALWYQSASFLAEIDRIAETGEVSVVEAPVWNCPGIAALLSGRYRVVTSLQTTLKLSLSSRPDLIRNRRVMEEFVTPVMALEKLVIERADRVLAISTAIAGEIEAAYDIRLDPRKLWVSHLGMPDWSKACAVSKPPGAGQNVLFVGRLEKRKGIDVLLAVIPTLCRLHPDAVFHIVGDDTLVMDGNVTYRRSFTRAHADLIRSGQVIFHGKVGEDELRAHYAASDIFAAPSRFESFGLIFLEAMMFAKPVIGTRAGGMPEIIVDGETGLLAAPGDETTLAAAIDRLLKDRSLRERLGAAGRQRYLDRFSDVSMAEHCVALYESLRAS
jgi:glycogen synthase